MTKTMASAVKAEQQDKKPVVSSETPLPVSGDTHTNTGNPAWGRFLELPSAARTRACAPDRLRLRIYLRAGTAGGPGVGAAELERGCDARMPAGMRTGMSGMRAGMQRAVAQLPRSADPIVRRGWRGPGLRNAGRCIWRRWAQQAGDPVLRSGGAVQRHRGCSAQAPLRSSGSPCSRSCAPTLALRAPAVVLRAQAQAPRASGAPRSLTPAATRLPSPRSVFIGFQCSKITGFPHCFLLFTQRHGNPWIPSISKTKGFPENFTLRNP